MTKATAFPSQNVPARPELGCSTDISTILHTSYISHIYTNNYIGNLVLTLIAVKSSDTCMHINYTANYRSEPQSSDA